MTFELKLLLRLCLSDFVNIPIESRRMKLFVVFTTRSIQGLVLSKVT
jgi:hypothetical protein